MRMKHGQLVRNLSAAMPMPLFTAKIMTMKFLPSSEKTSVTIHRGARMNEPAISCLPNENRTPLAEIDELHRRLVNAERMFQGLAECLNDVVFTARPDGSWDFTNALIYEITGLPAQSALGSGWTQALHADESARVIKEWQEAIAFKRPFESHFRIRTSEGAYRRFIAQANMICDDGGQVVRWVGTAMDVHDFLSAEDALHEARGETNEFIAKLAHDLRNVAAPIQYAIGVLQNPDANTALRQRAAEIIDGQLRELRVFLDRLQEGDRVNRKS
jgi:PAS domain S-box-containing protein